MKRYCLIAIPVVLFLLASCGKGGFPSIPSLTFKSIGPVENYSGDSVQIVCGFRDRQGDIQDSVYYKASNNSVWGSYAMPNFPAQNNMEGNIIVYMYRGPDFTPPAGTGATDTIYFNVFIKDLSGHSSDTIKTTPIIVHGN